MLTRDLIASCGHLDLLKDGDRRRLWSEQQLEASLDTILAARPTKSEGVWVFAYGSLIWNPMILYDDRQWATLEGWRRRFNMRMTLGRGSEEHPGRMLAIEPAEGSIRGVALHVPTDHVHAELRLLWRREMLTGAYTPMWVPVTLEDGEQVEALIFASNREHLSYERDHSVETIAPLIAVACGPYGSNADYVLRLHNELKAANSDDDDIDALADALLRHTPSPVSS
jgi:cation transport protein ChaC